jgi:hypothetical protein
MTAVISMVLIPFVAQVSSTAQKIEVHSICTILGDMQRFNKKVIAVRGVVTGSSEGSWLTDDSCSLRLVTEGYVWRNSISIESPGAIPIRDEIDFQLDQAALDRIAKQVKKMRYNRAADRLWLTYVGLFETSEKLQVATYPDGRRVPMGFGHLGGAPGQLLIKIEMDPFIERGKKRKP